MADENKSSLLILGIVAVVGIVGIFVIIKNSYSGVPIGIADEQLDYTSEDEDLVGEATKPKTLKTQRVSKTTKPKCTDTDYNKVSRSGIIFDKKGTVTYGTNKVSVDDFCLDTSYLEENFCVVGRGDVVGKVTYECQTGCTAGHCGQGENEIGIGYKCIDSDGINPQTKGNVRGKGKDRCLDTTKLEEYFCVGSNVFSFIRECQNGCTNGACKSPEGPKDDKSTPCEDSDGLNVNTVGWVIAGKDEISYPDKCDGSDYLLEAFCAGNERQYLRYECTGGCIKEGESGRCKSPSPDTTPCEDSDGFDWENQGYIIDGKSWDYCDGTQLIEYACAGDMRASLRFACQKCDKGRCI